MITNVLDCRGDHSAIDPVDAMVVSYALESDGRGVALARPNMREGTVREDVNVSDALAWAHVRGAQRALRLRLFEKRVPALRREF